MRLRCRRLSGQKKAEVEISVSLKISKVSIYVQVEGGTDPDDLEELEDAQSLAKVILFFGHRLWLNTTMHCNDIDVVKLTQDCIFTDVIVTTQVIKRRMAVDWAAEM